MPLELVSGPSFEPVSLADARRWLRLEDDDTANTPVLRMLIKAMREYAENLTHRAYVQRQYRLYAEGWPVDSDYGSRIELPFPPLASVDSVKYIDTSGTLITLAADQYVVHAEAEPAFVLPAYNVAWPAVRAVPDAVQVVFTAGYAPGSPPDEAAVQEVLPETLKLWMQSRMATLFENREQIIIGTIVNALPRDFVDGLLDNLTVGTRLF